MMLYRRRLVSVTALAFVLDAPAHAQSQPVSVTQPAADQPAPTGGAAQPTTPDTTTQQPETQSGAGAAGDEYGDEGSEIVVTGIRRGSVVGDIPPENILNSRDVRATGATSIDELLDA